jgi:predicted NodU family carbamoyl transferase
MAVISSQSAASAEQNNIWLNPDLRNLMQLPRRLVSHYLAHAGSALATSGFDGIAVLD